MRLKQNKGIEKTSQNILLLKHMIVLQIKSLLFSSFLSEDSASLVLQWFILGKCSATGMSPWSFQYSFILCLWRLIPVLSLPHQCGIYLCISCTVWSVLHSWEKKQELDSSISHFSAEWQLMLGTVCGILLQAFLALYSLWSLEKIHFVHFFMLSPMERIGY